MCLVLIAWRRHRQYPLVIAANRDEMHARPAEPAGFWPRHPGILAGRDREQGGAWLGITLRGRFAAVTNFREPGPPVVPAVSRGWLVQDFLLGREQPADYLREVESRADRYNGFSLIAGDRHELAYFSNRGGTVQTLGHGIYGISNHLLDTPWPKVRRGKQALAAALASGELSSGAVLDLLADPTPAPDEALPDTGVGRERERRLSAIFVRDGRHGTRCSTAILVDAGNRAEFTERSFNAEGGVESARQFDFRVA